ncbi:MAG TPA: hypothetical protein VF190_06265 [Rhodothermales bacterium]
MKTLTRILMLVVLFTGLDVMAARAQDDQEYKKAYNSGLEAAKAKKYDEAYQAFSRAVQLAKQAGDADVQSRALKIMTQLDYARGTSDLKAENWAAAIQDFDKGIANDPKYAKNYYGKAMALKNQNNWPEALAMYKKAIEVATASGERDVAQQAQGAIRDQYIFLASSALAGDGGNPTRAGATAALEHLAAAEQELPSPDADVFYYRAEAYKVLGEYDQAVAAADRALELHTGSKTDKAKIYFVKGEALMLNGNNDAAKLAFQEAQFGNFKASAQHYLETL